MTLRGCYGDLLRLLQKRKQEVIRFLHYLENQTNWLDAPASTKYHLDCAGGLVLHSVLTTKTLLSLKSLLYPSYSDETCVIIGLFHDVGKVGSEEEPFYIHKTLPDGSQQFVENPNVIAMGLGARSLYLCMRFLSLSQEEAQAICYHDGQYVIDNRSIKNRERPLTLLLHFSDLWCSHVTEQQLPKAEIMRQLESLVRRTVE